MSRPPRPRRRRVLVALVASLAAALGAPPAFASGSAATTLRHQGRWVTDAAGRVRILHGVNMVSKLAASGYAPDGVGFGDDDAAFLARNGFDVVRLGIIWKALEPQPGQFDDHYLARVEKTSTTLRRHGIAVLLDFHQDLYNERFQGEGAPDWAVLGQAATEPVTPLAGFPADYILQNAVNHAFDAFWANQQVPGTGKGVQDLLGAAWAHVARRFAGRPGILGYNLLNEPWPGTIGQQGVASQCATAPGACGVKQFEGTTLTDFSRRLTRAIRAVDRRTVVWPAPLLVFDFGLESGLGRVDARAGFAFNAYCAQASGQDAVIPFLRGKPCSYSAGLSFKNAEAVSRRTGAALFMSEFGASNDLGLSKLYLDGADRHMVGWTYWAYCGCGDPTGDDANEGIVRDPARPLTGANVEMAKLLLYSRPHPTAVAGTPLGWRFTPATKTFTLRYSPTRAGGRHRFSAGSVTEISTPRIQFPSGYGVHVRGARVASGRNAATVRLRLCPGAHRVSAIIAPGRTQATARRCR